MSCPREENKQFELNKLLEHVNRYSGSYSDWINYYSNVGLTSAGLNISNTTYFVPPQLTTIQRNTITLPPSGVIIFNIDTKRLNYYTGTNWFAITGVGPA
jgi:hypothetical protein